MVNLTRGKERYIHQISHSFFIGRYLRPRRQRRVRSTDLILGIGLKIIFFRAGDSVKRPASLFILYSTASTIANEVVGKRMLFLFLITEKPWGKVVVRSVLIVFLRITDFMSAGKNCSRITGYSK